MFRRGLAVGALVFLATAAGLMAAGGSVWDLNLDGATGRLELTTGADGSVTGTALGEPVTGHLVGRRITLVRRTATGAEIWEGWVSSPVGRPGPAQVMAGSATVPGSSIPVPWFATVLPAEATTTAPQATGTPARTVGQTHLPPPALSAPPRARTSAPETQARVPSTTSGRPAGLSGRPTVAGIWRTPDGPLEIRQWGSRLTFVLPDQEVEGRLTGAETLIGGFAPGCCKGTLKQGFTVITWSNGISWYREP